MEKIFVIDRVRIDQAQANSTLVRHGCDDGAVASIDFFLIYGEIRVSATEFTQTYASFCEIYFVQEDNSALLLPSCLHLVQ